MQHVVVGLQIVVKAYDFQNLVAQPLKVHLKLFHRLRILSFFSLQVGTLNFLLLSYEEIKRNFEKPFLFLFDLVECYLLDFHPNKFLHWLEFQNQLTSLGQLSFLIQMVQALLKTRLLGHQGLNLLRLKFHHRNFCLPFQI